MDLGKINLGGRWKGVGKVGLRLLVWLSRGWPRGLVMFLMLLATLWLGYVNVWKPLKQEVPLPGGVEEENPQLNVQLLRSINAQRNARLTDERPGYESFSLVFEVPEGYQSEF